jgi:hypothetical protein
MATVAAPPITVKQCRHHVFFNFATMLPEMSSCDGNTWQK